MENNQIFKYWAFISYSHQDNREKRQDGTTGWVCWADWLYKHFQTYTVPPNIVGKKGRYEIPIPERAYPVFRDKNELPTSGDLNQSIIEALDDSLYLIVICSLRSQKSIYVNEEIKYFKQIGRANRVLALIINGEPNASDKGNEDQECFPEALKYEINQNGKINIDERKEPIAADIRIPDSTLEIRLDNIGQYEKLLSLELMRITAGVIGVGLSQLIDWDRELKHQEAIKRFQSGKEKLHHAGSISYVNDSAKLIRALSSAEQLFEDAINLDPDQTEFYEAIGDTRNKIFNISVKNADLTLSTIYIEKIKKTRFISEKTVASHWNELESAWRIYDPSKNRSLANAFLLSLSNPLLSYLYTTTFFFSFLKDSTSESTVAVQQIFLGMNFIVIGIQSGVILSVVKAIQGHRKAYAILPLLNYILCFASIFGFNAVSLVISLLFAGVVFRTKNYSLIWKS